MWRLVQSATDDKDLNNAVHYSDMIFAPSFVIVILLLGPDALP
jgi:hypothetical protein